jgi:hypothetical protein
MTYFGRKWFSDVRVSLSYFTEFVPVSQRRKCENNAYDLIFLEKIGKIKLTIDLRRLMIWMI